MWLALKCALVERIAGTRSMKLLGVHRPASLFGEIKHRACVCFHFLISARDLAGIATDPLALLRLSFTDSLRVTERHYAPWVKS